MWQSMVDWVVSNLVKREEGQGMAEYALILFLVAIVVAAALTPLASAISGVLQQVGNAM